MRRGETRDVEAGGPRGPHSGPRRMMGGMWLLLAAALSGACGYMLRSPAGRPYRASAARMGVSPDRMPSQGMLYEGWGIEQLGHLNNSCALIDMGYARGLNRFELAVAIAHRAKESAYAAAEEAPLGVQSPGGVAYRPRKSHVVRAMQELRDEADACGELQLRAILPEEQGRSGSRASLAPSPPEQLRASETAPRDGFAAGGGGGPGPVAGGRVSPGGTPPPSLESLDGDGGAAKLEDINQMLLASDDGPTGDGDSYPSPGRAGRRASGVGVADDGLEALLAGFAGVDLDDDFEDDLDLDLGDFDPREKAVPRGAAGRRAGADVVVGGGGLEALLGAEGGMGSLLGDGELIDDEKLLELLGGDASML